LGNADLIPSPSHSDLAAAVVIIQRLAHAAREGDRDALDQAAPLLASVPSLRDVVHQVANGLTYGEIQGGRSRARKAVYEVHYVARARAYSKRRNDPEFEHLSDRELKALCGDRPVRHPTKSGEYLRSLARPAAIKAINEGLRLIATGRFALSSRQNVQEP
jgi:hypothetical protein